MTKSTSTPRVSQEQKLSRESGQAVPRGSGGVAIRDREEQTRTGHVRDTSRLDLPRLDHMESFGGILFPGGLHTQKSLQLALNVPFQETDVLIVSYPKSGKNSGPWQKSLRLKTSNIVRTNHFLMDLMETNDGTAFSLTRHHMDAGDHHSHTEQRRPPPVPHRPQLGSGSLAGASLFCWVTGSFVEATSSVHHTPACSPAGTCPPEAARLQCQGQIMSNYV